jgi:DNA phosphorothioation-associated putative methyltransferase
MNLGEYKEQVGRIPYGKRLPTALYVHREGLANLGGGLGVMLDQVVARYQVSAEFNVVKFRTDELKVSFLAYPEFESDPHPALKQALAIDLVGCEVRRANYADNINPPILHRKEQMVPMEHPRRGEFAALTEAEEAEGLYADTRTIGFRLNWERLLSRKGVSIEGHTLRRIDGDWIEPVDRAELVVERYRTALRRYELSKPVKCLMQYGLLKPGKSFFDYGCGLGTDMSGLGALGYSVGGWDPKFRPKGKKAAAEVVNLGYVVNVIEDPVERLEALCGAWELTREVLVVAAMIQRTSNEESRRLMNDGVLTQRNTFQKYFEQRELQQYIEDALDSAAVPVALGVFVVFRNPVSQQEFIARRTRHRIDWVQVEGRLGLGTPATRRGRARIEDFEQNKELLGPFWESVLERGRIPLPQEFAKYGDLAEKVGSAKRALRIVLDTFGEGEYEVAMATRKNDLLVYLALANLRRPVPLKHLSAGLRQDMVTFFENYKDGLRRGKELLFAAGDAGEIEVACEGLQVGWQDEQALYFHHSLLERLPPILRIYCGCAEAFCGDLGRVDLIKLHRASGKLTFLVYDDIVHQSVPELRLRIKVNLRTGFVQVFDHSADHQVLCFKERFFGREHPRYQEWVEFGIRLRAAGVPETSFIGPSRPELDSVLARAAGTLAEESQEVGV